MMCFYRGLRVISKFRQERMEAIAHEINAYDVVALQEVCMLVVCYYRLLVVMMSHSYV